MLDKIRYWFVRNADQISWFIIGWMSLQGLNDILRGDVIGATMAWVLVGINYILVRR